MTDLINRLLAQANREDDDAADLMREAADALSIAEGDAYHAKLWRFIASDHSASWEGDIIAQMENGNG